MSFTVTGTKLFPLCYSKVLRCTSVGVSVVRRPDLGFGSPEFEKTGVPVSAPPAP